MTMRARYCQRCGTAMRYMDYGSPTFRCWGLACPNCESRAEERRQLLEKEREKAKAAKLTEKLEAKPEEYLPYEKCPQCQHSFISEHETHPPRHQKLHDLKKQLMEANALLEKANDSVTSQQWHADYHIYKATHPPLHLFTLTEEQKREAEQEAAEKLLKAIEELPEDEEKQL